MDPTRSRREVQRREPLSELPARQTADTVARTPRGLADAVPSTAFAFGEIATQGTPGLYSSVTEQGENFYSTMRAMFKETMRMAEACKENLPPWFQLELEAYVRNLELLLNLCEQTEQLAHHLELMEE